MSYLYADHFQFLQMDIYKSEYNKTILNKEYTPHHVN
jgi:hypothetical protein